jgi:hypothetical protein
LFDLDGDPARHRDDKARFSKDESRRKDTVPAHRMPQALNDLHTGSERAAGLTEPNEITELQEKLAEARSRSSAIQQELVSL